MMNQEKAKQLQYGKEQSDTKEEVELEERKWREREALEDQGRNKQSSSTLERKKKSEIGMHKDSHETL